MKVEQLAVMLEMDATELAGTLKLQVADEVQDEILIKEIRSKIKETEITKLREGKTQGEGMAKRTIYLDVEKRIKETFGASGDNLESILEDAKKKFESKPKGEFDRSEFDKQIEIQKEKARLKEEESNMYKAKLEKIELKDSVMSGISEHLKNFKFASSKLQNLAIDEFVNSNKFIFSDGELFLEIAGKPSAQIEKHVNEHFAQFGISVQEDKKQPFTNQKKDSTRMSEKLPDLYKSLHEAKTAQEKADIFDKIKSLESEGITN